MTDERDRALEIIYPVLRDKIGYVPLCKAIEIVDALLDRGCSFPPCATLYAIVNLYKRSKIVGHEIAKYNINCVVIGGAEKAIYRCYNASNEWADFAIEEIGKSIFFSREEAEKAIASGGGQNERLH